MHQAANLAFICQRFFSLLRPHCPIISPKSTSTLCSFTSIEYNHWRSETTSTTCHCEDLVVLNIEGGFTSRSMSTHTCSVCGTSSFKYHCPSCRAKRSDIFRYESRSPINVYIAAALCNVTRRIKVYVPVFTRTTSPHLARRVSLPRRRKRPTVFRRQRPSLETQDYKSCFSSIRCCGRSSSPSSKLLWQMSPTIALQHIMLGHIGRQSPLSSDSMLPYGVSSTI